MADQPTNPILQVTSQLAALWQRQPRGRRLLAIGVVLAIAGLVLWTTVLHRPAAPVVVSESASPDDTEEMVDMITASRAYEAGITSMSTAVNMAERALGIGK